MTTTMTTNDGNNDSETQADSDRPLSFAKLTVSKASTAPPALAALTDLMQKGPHPKPKAHTAPLQKGIEIQYGSGVSRP